jgi:hypothetical protein
VVNIDQRSNFQGERMIRSETGVRHHVCGRLIQGGLHAHRSFINHRAAA